MKFCDSHFCSVRSLEVNMKIGFFDSGIGGLTVLSEALKRLPNHEYLYYADTLHAPYGPKPKDEVRKYIFEAIEFLVREGAEIIVIACNTATSIAVADLRQKYSIPIIGMEPAVKPAIEHVTENEKRVLVTATPLTLREEKLKNLIDRLDHHHQTDLLPLPGLVRLAESYQFSDEKVIPYLETELESFDVKEYGAVVLGCTHFPLFIPQFEKIFSSSVRLIDGSSGTVSHLENLIHKFQSKEGLTTSMTFYRSGEKLEKRQDIEAYTKILKQLKAI